jgi:hypothetical protein
MEKDKLFQGVSIETHLKCKSEITALRSHITRTIALLDDMRMVDKYNSRVQFKVLEWEEELRSKYPDLVKEVKDG